MASLVVISWRGIPAQVIVKEGRRTAKRELPRRFVEAIDRAAMRENLAGTDDYLAQWQRSTAVPCGDDLEAEAERAARAIEDNYGPDALRRLSEAGGWGTGGPP